MQRDRGIWQMIGRFVWESWCFTRNFLIRKPMVGCFWASRTFLTNITYLSLCFFVDYQRDFFYSQITSWKYALTSFHFYVVPYTDLLNNLIFEIICSLFFSCLRNPEGPSPLHPQGAPLLHKFHRPRHPEMKENIWLLICNVLIALMQEILFHTREWGMNEIE